MVDDLNSLIQKSMDIERLLLLAKERAKLFASNKAWDSQNSELKLVSLYENKLSHVRDKILSHGAGVIWEVKYTTYNDDHIIGESGKRYYVNISMEDAIQMTIFLSKPNHVVIEDVVKIK